MCRSTTATARRPRSYGGPVSTGQMIVIILITTAGSIAQGSVGIGLGLIAGPALVAIDPAFVPGPLLVVAQIVGIRHILAERQHADLGAWRHGMLGLPVGLAAALVVLSVVSRSMLAVIVGGSTAAAAVILLAGVTVQRTRTSEIVAGVFSTFASVTASLPGPPLVCVYADMSPPKMRSTASMLVIWIAAIGFVGLLVSGNFGRHEFDLLLWLLPGAVIGLVASRWVRPFIDKPWFRQLILVVAMFGGLALVARQLL